MWATQYQYKYVEYMLVYALSFVLLAMCCFHRINSEETLQSCVKWNDVTSWNDREPGIVVRNQLSRMINDDQTVGIRVYDIIIKSIDQTKLSELCNWVKKSLKIWNSNINTFDQLTNIVSKHIIAQSQIYVKHIVTIDTIKSIVETLEEENVTDNSEPVISQSPKSLDNINKDVLSLLVNYLPIIDLLRVCYVNRLWYLNIMNSTLMSRYKACKTLKLTSKASRDYCIAYSSQWPYHDLKVLHIFASEDQLEESDVPKFTQQSIQYLDSPVFHCANALPHLRAIRIWGNDGPISLAGGQSWLKQNDRESPLILTVIVWIYLYEGLFIPNTKSILFEGCVLNNDVIKRFICNKETVWIGIQDCELIGSLEPWIRRHYTPTPTAEINKCQPNIKLNYIYSCDWNKIYSLLKTDSIYDKYVCDFQMICHYLQINADTIKVFQTLATVTNCNKPKSIRILFQFNGKTWNPKSKTRLFMDFNQMDACIWGFILEYYESIRGDANIDKFEIGLIRIDGDYKTGDLFDLKKFKDSKDEVAHYRAWNEILYIKEEHNSPTNWEKAREEIVQSIPID